MKLMFVWGLMKFCNYLCKLIISTSFLPHIVVAIEKIAKLKKLLTLISLYYTKESFLSLSTMQKFIDNIPYLLVRALTYTLISTSISFKGPHYCRNIFWHFSLGGRKSFRINIFAEIAKRLLNCKKIRFLKNIRQ